MRNPFKPTAGAEPPYLIGRESSLESFIEGLQDGPGSPGLLSLITGPRGIGKTALLHRSEKFAKEYGWAVVSETATPGLLARIGSSVDEHLKRPGEGRSGRKVTGLHAAGFGITAELTPEEQVSLRRRLTDLVTRLAERHQTGVLITVDEIHSADRAELTQLAATVQHLIRESLPIALIGAGIPKAVSDLLNDEVTTFLRRADPIVLADVQISAVRGSLERTFEETSVGISAEHLDQAATATGGYPFLIQLVGYHVWRFSKDAGHVTEESLERGIEAARRRLGSTVLATSLADLSDVDKTFLLKMALDAAPTRLTDIADRMGRERRYVSVYRKRLIDAGVIRSAGRGYVEFAVPHLAEHLREHAAQLHEPGLRSTDESAQPT